MKEEIKTQKGFIQIPLLIGIVAFIAAVGVATGVVLHKQGELPSTASISEIFKGAEETIVESGEIKSKIEQVSESSKEVVTPEISKSSDEEIQQKATESGETQQLGEAIETQEELQLETESEVEPEPKLKPQSELKSQEEELELDLCAGIICPACQYCLNGKCIARPDGYNDCGNGCQRCINGSCQDYDAACSNCQYCSSDVCANYCQGTDNSCGCTTCINCDDLDGCSGDNYLDYYCSGTSCIFNSDDCSDCSCSCGGYNVEESIANGNCSDGKDNDCDGTVDSSDSGCVSPHATIIRLVDTKGNTQFRSEYNNRNHTWPNPYPVLRVGETITIRVDVDNTVASPVVYEFVGTGFPNTWQTDNQVTITIDNDIFNLETIHLRVFVKNSDNQYRAPYYDDMIQVFYKKEGENR